MAPRADDLINDASGVICSTQSSQSISPISSGHTSPQSGNHDKTREISDVSTIESTPISTSSRDVSSSGLQLGVGCTRKSRSEDEERDIDNRDIVVHDLTIKETSSSSSTCSFFYAEEDSEDQESSLDMTQHTPGCMSKFNSIVAQSASGCWVTDMKGDRYLDLSAGIGVLSTGHCHKHVVAAAQQQCASMILAQQNCINTTPTHKALVRRLLRIMPKPLPGQEALDNFFFCNSGAEAIDNAIKMARMVKRKPNLIVLQGGYHGRTFGSMACTTSKTSYRRCFGPLMGGVFVCDFDADYSAETLIRHFERILEKQTDPLETCAVLLEPILGEGGIIQVPGEFVRHLRRRCTELDMFLILDEVQSGMGRTGKWWAHELVDGVFPDLMIFAKGIASGFPLAGVAASRALVSQLLPNALGGTYGGNAVAVAAAAATIDVIANEDLLLNAELRGNEIRAVLDEAQDTIARELGLPANFFFTEIRQYGLFLAVDLNTSSKGLSSAAFIKAAEEHKMIMIPGGKNGIRITPPLIISAEEVNVFKGRLCEVLRNLSSNQS